MIARHTARSDLTVGLPSDVTGPFDTAQLVGDIGNLVPLRIELDEADTFAAVVAEVRAARQAGAEHATLPFKLILDALGVEPDAGRLPLVQIGFAGTGEPAAPVEADGVRIGCEQVDAGAGTFELALEVSGGTAAVRFATSLYGRATATRLLDRYLQTLGALCAQPDRPLGDAPLGTPQEREAVLRHWNAPIGDPADTTLHELFAGVVAADPDHTALAWQGGSLSYRTLDTWSCRIADELVGAGVGLGDLVPVVMERGPALIAAVLGVMRAGAAYVPLDIGQPDERLTMILEDTGATTVVVSAGTAARVPEPLRLVVGTDPVHGTEDACHRCAPAVVPPASAAYVIYTSGSTGRPKGVWSSTATRSTSSRTGGTCRPQPGRPGAALRLARLRRVRVRDLRPLLNGATLYVMPRTSVVARPASTPAARGAHHRRRPAAGHHGAAHPGRSTPTCGSRSSAARRSPAS